MPADLIAKLEAAEGPSRELDAEIVRQSTANCVGVERGPIGGDAQHYEEWLFRFDPPRSWVDSWLHVPRYTSSLDAALTLVPEGWMVELWLAQPTETQQWHSNAVVYYERRRASRGEGATPAIALSIAALRARGEG